MLKEQFSNAHMEFNSFFFFNSIFFIYLTHTELIHNFFFKFEVISAFIDMSIAWILFQETGIKKKH